MSHSSFRIGLTLSALAAIGAIVLIGMSVACASGEEEIDDTLPRIQRASLGEWHPVWSTVQTRTNLAVEPAFALCMPDLYCNLSSGDASAGR